jgi:peptidoglycan/LPS O-acetylase OafA/YrhL
MKPQRLAEHGRYDYLDGLRGLAAVQVLLGHCVLAFFPAYVATLGFVVDGDFAVLLFFVMSGFVLAFSFERAPHALAANAIGRVIRLGLPLAAAATAAFAAISLLPNWYQQAAELAHSTWLAKKHLGSLLQAAADSTALSLLTGSSNTTLFGFLSPYLPPIEASADGPTWSLHVEFWGSMLVLLLVLSRARSAAHYYLAAAASVVLIGGNALILFVLGHAAALLIRSPAGAALVSKRVPLAIAGIVALVAGTYLAGHGEIRGMYTLQRIAMVASVVRTYSWFQWHKELAAVLIFAAVLMLAPLQSVLRTQPLQWLGKMSFSVYLLHVPILMTIGALAYVSSWKLGAAAAGGIAVLSVCVATALLAMLFERLIDRPAIKLSRAVRKPAAPPAAAQLQG